MCVRKGVDDMTAGNQRVLTLPGRLLIFGKALVFVVGNAPSQCHEAPLSSAWGTGTYGRGNI